MRMMTNMNASKEKAYAIGSESIMWMSYWKIINLCLDYQLAEIIIID